MRIVSLISAATEMLYALGLWDQVVGVMHVVELGSVDDLALALKRGKNVGDVRCLRVGPSVASV